MTTTMTIFLVLMRSFYAPDGEGALRAGTRNRVRWFRCGLSMAVQDKLFVVDDSRDGAAARLETLERAHYNEAWVSVPAPYQGAAGPDAAA